MAIAPYEQRRAEIEHYFDRTAADAWARMTSHEPLGRIRRTVREGRDRMRNTLLDWLPADLSGTRVLDAGCGTGMLSAELAQRGADVVAVDLSPTLIALARERIPSNVGKGSIQFQVGDMSSPDLGNFDFAVAMDSLIHYRLDDVINTVSRLAERVDANMLFTFAPRTPLLAAMHAVGRIFPKTNRSPSLQPINESALRSGIAQHFKLSNWQADRSKKISHGFYTSQAMEIKRQ